LRHRHHLPRSPHRCHTCTPCTSFDTALHLVDHVETFFRHNSPAQHLLPTILISYTYHHISATSLSSHLHSIPTPRSISSETPSPFFPPHPPALTPSSQLPNSIPSSLPIPIETQLQPKLRTFSHTFSSTHLPSRAPPDPTPLKFHSSPSPTQYLSSPPSIPPCQCPPTDINEISPLAILPQPQPTLCPTCSLPIPLLPPASPTIIRPKCATCAHHFSNPQHPKHHPCPPCLLYILLSTRRTPAWWASHTSK
jgi:hypothetical protein